MVLYNLALVDEATPDIKSACEWLRQSSATRPGIKPVEDKYESLKCKDLVGH